MRVNKRVQSITHSTTQRSNFKQHPSCDARCSAREAFPMFVEAAGSKPLQQLLSAVTNPGTVKQSTASNRISLQCPFIL